MDELRGDEVRRAVPNSRGHHRGAGKKRKNLEHLLTYLHVFGTELTADMGVFGLAFSCLL